MPGATKTAAARRRGFARSTAAPSCSGELTPPSPVADQREEAVVADLDRVDVEHTLGGGDEAEVDRVREGPDLPRAEDLGEQLVLHLVDDVREALGLEHRHVAEEHHAKDRVPHHLVDEDLGEDRLGVGARDLAVEEAVEVVRGRAVDQEAEGGQAEEAEPVEGVGLLNKFLRQDVTNAEADQGGERLRKQGLLVQEGLVALPQAGEWVLVVALGLRGRGCVVGGAAVAAAAAHARTAPVLAGHLGHPRAHRAHRAQEGLARATAEHHRGRHGGTPDLGREARAGHVARRDEGGRRARQGAEDSGFDQHCQRKDIG
eukprot:CAMPEP_0206163642 /NCGR_PEP_ID=MMETSP1474-20131121/11536_1 /ASSEMBLY_ACC=CAM_ASM_001110 /TAXON_ID=97495 /ORGANISM="Imantonia sp., Strain RCC918" /LENGTH=315 /DNA_ID=CAMNT_0053566191 /DNA_START=301 /DNA_END=1245 /DNA_ORIENTATION=-